jgi:hypothetical protein
MTEISSVVGFPDGVPLLLNFGDLGVDRCNAE